MRILNIKLVSAADDGTPGNFGSYHPVFSPDGTRVAFDSTANNLAGNSGGIFEKDLESGVVTRIPTEPGYIVTKPIYTRDGAFSYTRYSLESLQTDQYNFGGLADSYNDGWGQGEPAQIFTNGADEPNRNYTFSANGTKVAFESGNNTLVVGDSGDVDIFVGDLSGNLILASTAADGTKGNRGGAAPGLSSDGTMVAFWSYSDNLVENDTNNNADIFVKNLITHKVTLVSVAADGTQGNGLSFGTPSFSPDGTKVAFQSYASNLVADDGNNKIDIFVKDLVTGELTRVSVATDGAEANGSSVDPVFSPDGTKLMFASDATNLVAGDTNRSSDIFIVTLGAGRLVRGTDGADKLHGSADADIITGFAGKDKLYGEGGADTFVFLTGDSGKTRAKADTIYDFTRDDTIDLSGWDANATKVGIQAFDFIGKHAFHRNHAGELHVVKTKSDTWIEGNTDNDKKAEFVIHLDDAVKLTAENFDGLL
jgi:Tol biopolymer transport system component